jgi:hypothetical protein
LYYSPSIIRIIKSRRMRWAARMRKKTNAYRIFMGKRKVKETTWKTKK